MISFNNAKLQITATKLYISSRMPRQNEFLIHDWAPIKIADDNLISRHRLSRASPRVSVCEPFAERAQHEVCESGDVPGTGPTCGGPDR